MAYPLYVRERARELRTVQRLSLGEIAERLALPKTTVYSWIRDLPLRRPRSTIGQQRGTRAMQEKYRRMRDAAYEQGIAEFAELSRAATFRDFVVLYLAEGSKRDRNTVAICNSDVRAISLAAGWLRALTPRPLTFSIQYHADQDLDELRAYWAGALAVDDSRIGVLCKSNSGRLSGGHGARAMASCRSESATRSSEPDCRPGSTSSPWNGN